MSGESPSQATEQTGPEVKPVTATANAAGRRVQAAPAATPALNRLTSLAARLLKVDASQVSLLTDVQLVAGGAGLAPGAVGSTGPLEDSLCTVTSVNGAPLVVVDAVHDPRVAQLPPVTSGAVASYLGVPLTDGEGRPFGALCVFDAAPREWVPADVAVLEELARSVSSELDLAALDADYRADRAVRELAAEAGGVGTFALDLATGELVCDDRLLELSELDRATFGGRPEEVYARVHPDDVEEVTARVQQAITSGGGYDAEYRILLSEGGHRWVAARGCVVDAEHGGGRLIGVAHETTAQREGLERMAHALEAMAVGYLVMDGDWRITYANAEAERITGCNRAALLGAILWEKFPATVGTEFEVNYRHAAETGEPVTFDAFYPEPLNMWAEVRATPQDGGLALYFLDVTERVRLQQRSALLEEVTAELTGTLDAEEAIACLARLVVPALGDWCVTTLVDEERYGGARHGMRDVGWWHADPDLRPALQDYAGARLTALGDESFLARALTSGRAVVLGTGATEALRAVLHEGPVHRFLDELAPQSLVVLPLRGRGRTVGLLTLCNGTARGPISASELATASEIAARAGLALDNARLYRQQRQLSEGLQRSLLTPPVQPDGARIVVRYTPAAETAQVGGDWYDAFPQPGGGSIVTIGDVLGHNTEAAAAMGQIRSMLRAIAVTTDDGPGTILTRVDEAMTTLQTQTTATAVVVRLEPTEDRVHHGTRVRWSNAGHPPPMVIQPDGTVLPLAAGTAQLLLGVDHTAARRDNEVTLDPGAVLVLYTDGLIERRDQDLDAGLQRLHQALTDLAGRDLDDLCDELLSRLLPGGVDDDVALIAVRLDPNCPR